MCRPCLIRKAQDGESGEELPITAGTRDSEIIGYGQVPFQPPRYCLVAASSPHCLLFIALAVSVALKMLATRFCQLSGLQDMDKHDKNVCYSAERRANMRQRSTSGSPRPPKVNQGHLCPPTERTFTPSCPLATHTHPVGLLFLGKKTVHSHALSPAPQDDGQREGR